MTEAEKGKRVLELNAKGGKRTPAENAELEALIKGAMPSAAATASTGGPVAAKPVKQMQEEFDQAKAAAAKAGIQPAAPGQRTTVEAGKQATIAAMGDEKKQQILAAQNRVQDRIAFIEKTLADFGPQEASNPMVKKQADALRAELADLKNEQASYKEMAPTFEAPLTPTSDPDKFQATTGVDSRKVAEPQTPSAPASTPAPAKASAPAAAPAAATSAPDVPEEPAKGEEKKEPSVKDMLAKLSKGGRKLGEVLQAAIVGYTGSGEQTAQEKRIEQENLTRSEELQKKRDESYREWQERLQKAARAYSAEQAEKNRELQRAQIAAMGGQVPPELTGGYEGFDEDTSAYDPYFAG